MAITRPTTCSRCFRFSPIDRSDFVFLQSVPSCHEQHLGCASSTPYLKSALQAHEQRFRHVSPVFRKFLLRLCRALTIKGSTSLTLHRSSPYRTYTSVSIVGPLSLAIARMRCRTYPRSYSGQADQRYNLQSHVYSAIHCRLDLNTPQLRPTVEMRQPSTELHQMSQS